MDEGAADAEEIVKGVDPALYLALTVVALLAIFVYIQLRKKRKNADVDDFFSNLDGDKFNLKLPAAVDEYYEVKSKCEDEGWEPGQAIEGGQPSPHHRMLAQALMKRCMADIPIVSHIQRESAGMNKLYSQSMCSVKQWKSYQAAEAMVSAEVEEVRAEADEIEPGWSQVSSGTNRRMRTETSLSFCAPSNLPPLCALKAIWRQAMQYHNMLKQKEAQAKAQQEAQQRAVAEKKRVDDEKKAAEQARYNAIKKKVDEEKARIANAEKAAQELMKQEEREKESKKAFSSNSGGGMKKGFLG
ncbi:hypothetical protein ACHAWF_012366 [Thalassiosira exigua]